jgi:hypothetical protein
MRAYEFLSESEMHDWHKQGLPGMKSLHNVGQYYDIYRLGLAMAGAGNKKDPLSFEPDGVTEDNPTTLSYTQAEEDIINAALKHIGASATQISSRISSEPTDTYHKSPVANLGPVKRKS